jgi:hypothetical protein
MTVYRRDENGHVFADGGLIGNRTIDDARSEAEDFTKLLERRAGELPRRRLAAASALQRDRIEHSLGGVRGVDGKVACPECQTENDPDFDFCTQCGNPLVALEAYQGDEPGDTLKCAYCDRMNNPANNYCTGCGKALLVAKEEKKSKYRGPRP